MADEHEVSRLLDELKEAQYDVRGGRLAEADLRRFIDLCEQLKASHFPNFSVTLFPAAPNVGGGMSSVYTRIDGTNGNISTYKVSRVKQDKKIWKDELRWKPRREPGIYVNFKGKDSNSLCKLVNSLLQFPERCDCQKVQPSQKEKWLVEVKFDLAQEQP